MLKVLGRIIRLIVIIIRSYLERLRHFSSGLGDNDLRFDDINFRGCTAFGMHRTGVVFSRTSAGGTSLAGEVGKR